MDDAIGHSNFHLYSLSHANRIHFDSNKRSSGVSLTTGVTLFSNMEVVLSAGASQSPQLLMSSGVGPVPHLQQHGITVVVDRPDVGQNLTDHINFTASHRAKVETLTKLANSVLALLKEIVSKSSSSKKVSSPILSATSWSGNVSPGTSRTLPTRLCHSLQHLASRRVHLCSRIHFLFPNLFTGHGETDATEYYPDSAVHDDALSTQNSSRPCSVRQVPAAWVVLMTPML